MPRNTLVAPKAYRQLLFLAFYIKSVVDHCFNYFESLVLFFILWLVVVEIGVKLISDEEFTLDVLGLKKLPDHGIYLIVEF